ncbi:MAG: IclR family transcriptional regulator [Arthrobacter sp.]
MTTMARPETASRISAPLPGAPEQGSFDTSTSVLKALRLLDAFGTASQQVGVSELARQAGIHKSTAFRLLTTLAQGGFIDRVGSKYRLSWRVFELGNRVEHCAPQGLRDLALPYLSELFTVSGRTVHLAVLNGPDVVYLEKIHSHKSTRLPTAIGGRMPATCSALGKAILAFSDKTVVDPVLAIPLPRFTQYSITQTSRLIAQLHKVQQEGVAYDREEVALGLTCVAAPVIRHGRAVAAISVSSPTNGFNAAATAEMVRHASKGISRALVP